MYRIAYVLDKHTPSRIIQEVQQELPTEVLPIELSLFYQKDLDKQDPLDAESDWHKLDSADFIFLYAHGLLHYTQRVS